MKNFKHSSESGVTLVFSVIIAVIMGILVLSLARMMDFNAHQMTYFSSLDSAYKLAETGMNAAVAQLIRDPDPTHVDRTPKVIEHANSGYIGGHYLSGKTEVGVYENKIVETRNSPLPNIYYIVTSATRTVEGRHFNSILHTYARVSNVGEYFAAINSELTIQGGANLSQGRVYAPRITFLDPGTNPKATLLSAEFVYDVAPPIDNHGDDDPSNDTWPSNWATISTTYQPHGAPLKLKYPLLFPQIFQTDLDAWKDKADTHTVTNVFFGDIYPPGYAGALPIPGDNYALHTTNNAHHIYYFNGDMYIRGTVHGQVLFVASGNIYITGDLVKAATTDPLPGAGFANASTAHQAVLITQGTVYISSGATINGIKMDSTAPGGVAPVTTQTQKVQALIMAPNASLVAQSYGTNPSDPTSGDNYHNNLALEFTGTWVLAHVQSTSPGNLPSVFKAPGGAGSLRIYKYDESFKTNPPPYLPALVEIYYCLERSASDTGIFGGRNN